MSVDEARRSLGPVSALPSLKNFDYLVTPKGGPALLVEVKTRRYDPVADRLQNWVSRDDVESLVQWQDLLRMEHGAVFVFVYWSSLQPADGRFEDLLRHDGRWYGLTAAGVDDYARQMRRRSSGWDTVHLPEQTFLALRRPLFDPMRSVVAGPDSLLRRGCRRPMLTA